MRKIVNSTYVTLDGVIEDPQDWPSMGGFSDAGTVVQTQLLARCDAILLGRETYDGLRAGLVGPVRRPAERPDERAPQVRRVDHERRPQWPPTTVIDHDPVEAIRELKEQPGADIVQYGFGPLAHALMAAGLLDELGCGCTRSSSASARPTACSTAPGSAGSFELADALTLDSGIVILTYRS